MGAFVLAEISSIQSNLLSFFINMNQPAAGSEKK